MVATGKGMARLKAETTGVTGPGNTLSAHFEPAVVTAVSPGAAADGNAIVTVKWRGALIDAAYPSTYFPGVGHTVLLAVQGPKVFILCHLIGTPQ